MGIRMGMGIVILFLVEGGLGHQGYSLLPEVNTELMLTGADNSGKMSTRKVEGRKLIQLKIKVIKIVRSLNF